MKFPTIHLTFSVVSAIAVLAGCGGSRPPIGAPVVWVQSYAASRKGDHSTTGALLYASQNLFGSNAEVFVFSYPEGGLEQTLQFPQTPTFLCSDTKGSVFIPTTDYSSPGSIYEFAHGGSQPIATLTDPGPGYAWSCAIDPTTGNLAVANGSNVAVYPQASGTPIIYDAPYIAYRCAYDDSGDLFVDGNYGDEIAELPAGRDSLSYISLSENIYPRALQWWKGALYTLLGAPNHFPYKMFQIRVSGSEGTVSGPMLLDGGSTHRGAQAPQFLLYGKSVIAPGGPSFRWLSMWHFPAGGKSYRTIKGVRDQEFYGVAISK